MPFTADYRCDTCGHIWEAWLDNSDDQPDACEECGGKIIYRQGGGHIAVSNDPEVRSAMLKKRSADHSAKHFKNNLDRVRSRIMKR